METRREFLAQTLAAAALPAQNPAAKTPWYRRAYRWGQTNITENDPVRYDIAWWREYWKRTRVQGVIINAGGIVAYYPSKFPLHHRAEFLGDRDLYGELAKAAHDDGLAVLARMDSNRAAEEFYQRAPGLVRPRRLRQPLPRRRQVRHLHQQPLLRRVHPGRPPRDHRALPPRRLHRQQLERTRPRQHLLLRQLRAQVPRQNRRRPPDRSTTGTTASTGSGSSGTTRAGSRSGTSTTAPPKPRAVPTASGSA